MKRGAWDWLEIALRICLGGLFVYAGALKALDPGEFLIAIRGFDLAGDPWAALLAMFLPWLEIACGLGLMFKALYRGALAIVTGSLLVFLVAILSAWVRGLDIECGCFGPSDQPVSYWGLVLRDLGMLAAAAWLLARSARFAAIPALDSAAAGA